MPKTYNLKVKRVKSKSYDPYHNLRLQGRYSNENIRENKLSMSKSQDEYRESDPINQNQFVWENLGLGQKNQKGKLGVVDKIEGGKLDIQIKKVVDGMVERMGCDQVQ